MRFVYLAYPIDQVGADQGQTIYRAAMRAKVELSALGMGVYDPYAPWTMPPELRSSVGPEIAAVNRAALAACGGVLAILPKGVPTVGVPMEIERAAGAGKPVAVLSDAGVWSLQDDRIYNLGSFTDASIRVAAEWLRAQEPKQDRGGRKVFYTVDEGGMPPSRGYPDDAGIDLYVAVDTVIPPGEFVDVPSGVKVEMPPDVWGMLTGRSSTLRKKGLMVNQGVIDPGYRGELYSGVWNLTRDEVKVAAGERIAQLILIGNATRLHRLVEVAGLSPSDRGTNGFGSTGA